MFPSLRRTIAAIDPEVAVGMRRMEEDVATAVSDRRFSMLVLGTFAGLAVALAIIGIYGVVSYTVAQRSREIGVRRALGATTGQLRRLVLTSTLFAIGPGLLGGALLSAAGARALGALLYGVSPFDVPTLVGAIVLLGMAGLLASLVPAARAARVDPVIAIRSE
jgi:putative ABC transport system permease protein